MQFNTYETYYYTRIIKALIFAHFIYLSSKSIKFLNIRYFILILLIRYSYRLSSAFSLNYDMLSVSLIILSCWLTLLIFSAQWHAPRDEILVTSFSRLLLVLTYSFTARSIIGFYFFFEWSLIPIFIIIMGWGYQPERLKAGICLIFYTLFTSLPLLVIILLRQSETFNLRFYSTVLCNSTLGNTEHIIIYISMILAFLVKFPIWGAHLWLPKAHVEAPVAGSMVLAGVLLKLGGYGLIRLITYYKLRAISNYIISLAVVGGGILAIVCTIIGDIKVVIAYSSVVHIALIIAGVISIYWLGVLGGAIVIIAHGVCSSGIFATANIMYERTHSRAIRLNKAALTLSPHISIIWFTLIIANFGGPFTLNLLGEVTLIINLTQISPFSLTAVCLLSFFSAAYSLILYSRAHQGVLVGSKVLGGTINTREGHMLIGHLWPLLFLCFTPAIC